MFTSILLNNNKERVGVWGRDEEHESMEQIQAKRSEKTVEWWCETKGMVEDYVIFIRAGRVCNRK